jgi:hypothetical protein
MKQLALFSLVFVSLFLSVPAAAGGPRSPIAELTASDGKVGSGLGESVAISDGTVFAGVLQLGKGASIYVFERPASGWGDMTQTAELTIPHLHFFFNALAASGDTVVAGVEGTGPNGYGALYVFEKPAGGWKNMTPTAVLSPTFGTRFGNDVAIAGDTIVAGDPRCGGNGDFGPGTAFVFQKPADGWHDTHETAVLSASDSQGCDDYGISVGASGDTVVVGADLEGMSPPPSPGEVYVFEKPAGGWTNMTETAELNLLEGFPGDGVGGNLAIGGNTVVSSMNNHEGQPRILVFEKPAGGWTNGTQTATLLQAAGGPLAVNPQGTAVAVDGDAAGIVKVYEEPASGWQNTSTATYRFSRSPGDLLGIGALGMAWLAAGAPGTTVDGHAMQGAVFLFFK